MRVLVVHPDHTDALSLVVQLSGNGFVAELVQDLDEAACRLSAMMYDAVLCSMDPRDESQMKRFREFRRMYPATSFYTQEQFSDFFDRMNLEKSR
jgi:hypothetical protein